MGAPPNLNIPVKGNVNILNGLLDLRYKQGFDQAKPWTGLVASEVSYTKGKTVVMPWTEPAKRFSRFLGEFKSNPWIVDAIQTTSEPWQSNIEVDRYETIENAIMQFGDTAVSLGVQAKLLGCDMLALALRTAGSSSATPFLWYDDLPVFSEVHPVDPRGVVPGTWRNLFKGYPLTHQNVIDIYGMMCGTIKLPNGRQVNCRPNKIGASGKYAMVLEEICKNSLIIKAIQGITAQAFGAVDNVLRGKLEPVIMDELSQEIEGVPGEEDVWYMWDDSRTKPMTLYWIQKPYVTPITSDTDYGVRKANAYAYLGEGHGVGAVTAPWFIGRVEPSEGP